MFSHTSTFRGRAVPISHRLFYLLRVLLYAPICITAVDALKGRYRVKSKRFVLLLNALTNGTNGKGLDWFNRIVIMYRRNDTKQFDSSVYSLTTERGVDIDSDLFLSLSNSLQLDGAIKIPKFLSTQDAVDLYTQVSLIPGSTINREYECLKHWLDSNDNHPRFISHSSHLNKIPTIQQVATNYLLQKIARDYLGVPPLIVDIQSWTTTATSDLSDYDLEQAAMAFHCDSDYIKFLKVFILLTDVTIDNGPFQFVVKSHRGRRHVAGRMPNSEIITPGDEIFNGTGKAGDLMIVDTRGWHKANEVVLGHRTMLQLIYTSSFFGGQTA